MSNVLHPVVRKTIGGISFDDAYAWLQPDSDEAMEWQWERDREAQAFARSNAVFDTLLRATELAPPVQTLSVQRRLRGGRWFHCGNVAGRDALFVGRDPAGSAEIIVDASDLDADAGAQTEFAGYEPSPDGSYVALTLRRQGRMIGTLAIVDVATRRVVESAVDRAIFLASIPAWSPDSRACYWADRSATGEHIVYRTTCDGETEPIAPLTQDAVPARFPGLQLHVSPDGARLIASSTPHDRRALLLADLPRAGWHTFLPADFSGECNGEWGDADTFFAIVTHDTDRGRVVAIPVATSQAPQTWRPLIGESAAVLRSLAVTHDKIVVCEMVDAAVRYAVYDLDGTPCGEMPLAPFAFSPDAFPPRSIPANDELLVTYGSFTQSLSTYRYDVAQSVLTCVAATAVRIEGLTVEQRFVQSTDNAQPTYFAIRQSDVLRRGPLPTLIVAYGGFNVAWMPKFLGPLRPFLAAGGTVIHAVLRGGGEYGQRWYDAGRLAAKQHTFDDLFAIAEDLIARGETVRELLAFKGDSNGGLTGGVAIVQRPDLWRVVVCGKPIFDMLEPMPDEPRFAGVASFFRHDFGDPADPACARTLAAYSPVHNVRAGVTFPTVFAIFGEHDMGSLPYHGRRFIAALRDADPEAHRHHLRVRRGVGHGATNPSVVAEQEAEWLAVVMTALGMRA